MSAASVGRAPATDPSLHRHPAYVTRRRPLRVVAMTPLTPDITHFRLADPYDARLASYQPGSHLVVSAGDRRNAYSLVDDGMEPDSYGISVLRRGDGGGSDWLHDTLAAGDLVDVEGPRSMFAPVLDQRHALLVAGGIGVTPVLSHARALADRGGSATVVYSYRPGHAAHLADLRALAASRPRIELLEAVTVEETLAVLRAAFADQPLGTHAYACGPVPMLDSYLALGAGAGWPPGRLHLERFTAPEQDPGSPFRVLLASSRTVLDVAPGVSVLQVLADAGVEVPSMCRQGVCGECRLPVRAGVIEHRDLVLTEDERQSGEVMLCCVSRAPATTTIEVDL
ncbi:PDR/VanB family oxidoreductase [Nocardioides sambongensis]|uniref:PDR/VanB family oxidoreductase n=1 Tax=Nocardioides sambongensis TaxID=2589074 RepID=UPI00112ED4F9|nr:PDR/VanB family oxidoreductase [Nocardioides sambongensis]